MLEDEELTPRELELDALLLDDERVEDDKDEDEALDVLPRLVDDEIELRLVLL